MFKVMGIAAIVSAWLAMGFDMVRRNDKHLDKLSRCMVETRNKLNVTPQDAYNICEKE